MGKLMPLDHSAPLLCFAGSQINLSTWHHFVPCGCVYNSDMRTVCCICSLVLWVLTKRKAEPVLSQNTAPLLPSSPLTRLGTYRLTREVVFLLWLVSAFHLFPRMAFLKHLELVTFACMCKVRVTCLPLRFQKQFLFRFTYG